MAKSLYEILEVNHKASKEAIDAAHLRLSEKFDPESAENRGKSDALLQYKAVREAYAILANPDRRTNYDMAHPAPGVVVVRPTAYSTNFEDEEPFWNFKTVLMAFLVVVAVGIFYLRYTHDRGVEAIQRARVEAEGKVAAERLAVEREKQLLEAIEQQATQRQAAQQESELRRFSQEVDRNQRDREREQQSAARQAARQQEYERRADEQRQQAQERAAASQARAEVADAARRLRQRELEEQYRRPKVIVIPDLRQKR